MNDICNHCLITLDRTDVLINEPNPFGSKWYSYKLNSPDLRYEIRVCI